MPGKCGLAVRFPFLFFLFSFPISNVCLLYLSLSGVFLLFKFWIFMKKKNISFNLIV